MTFRTSWTKKTYVGKPLNPIHSPEKITFERRTTQGINCFFRKVHKPKCEDFATWKGYVTRWGRICYVTTAMIKESGRNMSGIEKRDERVERVLLRKRVWA